MNFGGNSELEKEFRSGIGYDIHRFSEAPNRELWLGGVKIAESGGLEGHSDADVILHAIVDGILGGFSGGDIGQLFPNDDPNNKDRASSDFLRAAATLAHNRGWEIRHVDVAVQAESPKLAPHNAAMKIAIAQVLGIDSDRVSIKATTNEGLGAIGRNEGIAAFAVVTLKQV
jgi:2-C-methyl-D-erythritol 4-phosphate cytidylyltransferase/2-C-methyl-D-erythritol 2,4-cyclodiphosphate synthase